MHNTFCHDGTTRMRRTVVGINNHPLPSSTSDTEISSDSEATVGTPPDHQTTLSAQDQYAPVTPLHHTEANQSTITPPGISDSALDTSLFTPPPNRPTSGIPAPDIPPQYTRVPPQQEQSTPPSILNPNSPANGQSRLHQRATHVPPIVIDDEDITSPPPPYWSIDRSNDVLSTPLTSPSTTTNRQYNYDGVSSPHTTTTPDISSSSVDIDVTATLPPPPAYCAITVTATITNTTTGNSTTLTTSAPPSYRTLYQLPEEEEQNNVVEQQNNVEGVTDINDAVAPIQSAKDKRFIQFYSLLVGVVIPACMVILKQRSECAVKPSLVSSLIPGIVFHILHGLTTILTQGKSLKLDKMDIFIIILFFWNVSISVMIYSIDSDDDCDAMMYYFIFCLATVYNFIYAVVIIHIFKPLLKHMYGRAKAFFRDTCCST